MKYSDFSDICQLIYSAGMNGRTVHVVLVLAYWSSLQITGFLLVYWVLSLVSVLLEAYSLTITWHFNFGYIFFFFFEVSLWWPGWIGCPILFSFWFYYAFTAALKTMGALCPHTVNVKTLQYVIQINNWKWELLYTYFYIYWLAIVCYSLQSG